MATAQRSAAAVVILAAVAVILAVTGAAWPFWLAYAVVAAGILIELVRARRG
ncbi:hypothetical protein [Rhodococcus xishaensis]|uniref:hypothetical protein n=1 Tax=Rhodococcus xishaensis TaxID=2487364 RepID=UPI0013E2A6BC|nr:hypothetical protein [Rhodococcus xishaensis]